MTASTSTRPAKVSIVVPCYNEEESLPYFYDATTKVLEALPNPYEIVFVNDGSKDRTLEVLRGLAEKDEHVIFLSLSRNFGKEAAMYAGLRNASGEYVAFMDADLQDPPSLLPEMIDILDNGRDGKRYDSVATRRITRKGEPPIRSWFAHRFYALMNRLSESKMMDGARDFRMMRRNMVDVIVAMGEHNRFSKGIFGWVGFETFWLSYENTERVAGETKWSFLKLFKYAFDGIVSFSQTPIDVSSWLGLVMMLVSFVYALVIVVRTLFFGNPVDGWASMVSIILFVAGVQFLSIGMIGQYIAKIYIETKDRPIYVVAETNKDDADKGY